MDLLSELGLVSPLLESMADDATARAGLKEQGFKDGDLRSEAEMDLSHLSEWPISSLRNGEYAVMHPVA